MEYYSNTLTYIGRSSGKNITVLHDAFQVYQTLHAEENMNFTLPEWSINVYPDILSTIAGKQCEFENYNDILKRLNGGNKFPVFELQSPIFDNCNKFRRQGIKKSYRKYEGGNK